VNVEMLGQLGYGSVALDGGQSHLNSFVSEFVRLSVFAKVIEEGFMAMRSIALNVPGKVSDAVAEISGVQRGVIHSLINDEIYEVLTLFSSPDVVSRAMNRKPDRRRADIIEESEPA
jgi:hypothetical protein